MGAWLPVGIKYTCDIKVYSAVLSQGERAPGWQQLILVCLFLITEERLSATATAQIFAVARPQDFCGKSPEGVSGRAWKDHNLAQQD